MKIAIICSSFFPVIDGVTIAVLNRVKQLSALGYQVKIFCPDYSAIASIYPNWQDYTGQILTGVEVISLPSTKSLALDFERDVAIASYKIVIRELTKFQPDLIHVDEAERLSFCFLKRTGVKFAKQHRIPCTAWFHTNYIDYFDDYFQLPFNLNQVIKGFLECTFTKIYNSYDLTLVSSSSTLTKLTAMGINNLAYAELLGCNLARFEDRDHQSFAAQYNLPDLSDKIKLIFIGRLTPDKGWNFTLNSLAKLAPEILAKVVIIIAGDGTLKDEINQTLQQLTPDVYLLGRIPHQDISNLLMNGDIFITNSEKETRGLTVIEAAAAGIPAIAPRAGGVIDTIRDGETGFLYQPHNQTDFLQKLEVLICDRTLRKSMGTEAKTLCQQWSWQHTTDNLIEIWSQVISSKKLEIKSKK